MEGHPVGMGQQHEAHPHPGTENGDTLASLAHLVAGEQAHGAHPAAQQAPEGHLAVADAGDDGHAAKRQRVEDGGAAAPAPAPAAPPVLDPSAALVAQGALDPSLLVHLTPEQLAVLQQDAAAGVAVLTPEMLAAAMQGQTAVGPDGQPLQMQLPMLADPAAAQAFAAGDPAALGLPNIDVSILQTLTPEQLQAFIQSPSMAPFMVPGGFAIPGAMPPGTYKNWWDENDEKELLQIVTDPDYRREKTGSDELDWARLETYFNRSASALRKKFWTLSKNAGGNPAAYGVEEPPPEPLGLDAATMANAAALMSAAAAQQPLVAAPAPAPAPPPAHASGPAGPSRSRAERKNWSEEETQDMIRIVSDAEYRASEGLQHPGEEEVAFDRLAVRFGCSVQTAKRKYRHLQEQASANGGVVPEKRKREHYRKSVPYRWMIVSALSKMPGFEGTAPQIFEKIEADPELAGQLDSRIMPGTKHVPRWKIQIRKVLSADTIFDNTHMKAKHETIWRLNPSALQDANAERQRQRAGVPPINLTTAVVDPTTAAAAAAAAAGLQAGGAEAAMAAALGQLPSMGMALNHEQAMSVLSQQQQLMLGMQPGQVLALDPQQLQFMGLPEGTLLDPATLAAMVAAGPGGAAGADAAATAAGMPGADPAAAAAAVQQHADGNGALTDEQAASAAAAVAMALGHQAAETTDADAAAMAAWAVHQQQLAEQAAHQHQQTLETQAAAAAAAGGDAPASEQPAA